MKQPAGRGAPDKSKSLPPERSDEDVLERRRPIKRKVMPESSEEEKRPSPAVSAEKLTSKE